MTYCQGLAMCAHLENKDGICCEDLTATYSTSGATSLVGIDVVGNVIKILRLGTGPGDIYTLLEE